MPPTPRRFLGAALRGPFASLGALPSLLPIILLTVLTELGGVLIWPAVGVVEVFVARRRFAERVALRVMVPLAAYGIGTQTVVPEIARQVNRVPLPCAATPDRPLAPLTPLTCALQRNYLHAEGRASLIVAAREVAEAHPGTIVRFLDAGFPLGVLPVLPHLFHGDGRRIDLALLWKRGKRPVPGARSPIGYGGFAPGYERRCPPEPVSATRIPWLRDLPWVAELLPPMDLRWEWAALQPYTRDVELDVERTRTLAQQLVGLTSVRSVTTEPTLMAPLGAGVKGSPCELPRHDDHLHVSFR